MKKIFFLFVAAFYINSANAQVTLFPNISLESGVTGFTKYKLGVPISGVSSSYPYVEYNDVNALTTHAQAEIGIIYLPYGKKSDFGFKTAVSICQGNIKHAFLTGETRTYKTTVLNYGIKIYPFANNKDFAIAVSYEDADEGKKFYGAFLSGLFFEFGNSVTNSSFERLNFSTSQYETVKTKVNVFCWGERLAVFASKKVSMGIEISLSRYKFDLGGGAQGKKQINNTHAGIWFSVKLFGKK